MTLPREVIPGRFYLVTRRCTQRQFLMRPDAETNNGFIYCLGEAAQRFGIEVLLPVAMSNHYHVVVYDRDGTLPQFTEHFHKMFAKCQNALRGRWENFWSSEQVCNVRLVERRDVMNKLVYTATNPVKDDLVERVHHWPGVNGLRAFLRQAPLRAKRPGHFFRPEGGMPEDITLELVIPPELGDADEIRGELRQRVAAEVKRALADRLKRNVKVLGRSRVRKQRWHDNPVSREPRRNLRPTIAAKSKWALIEAIQRNRAFLDAYCEARKVWLENAAAAQFPSGTYWLRRFANVSIAA
jgi:REP element-mobilizing transposase RayT